MLDSYSTQKISSKNLIRLRTAGWYWVVIIQSGAKMYIQRAHILNACFYLF